MSNETTSDADESAEETQPTPGEDVATYKRRLAGKDQALTNTQKERDRLAALVEELTGKVTTYENANMSEIERRDKRIKELEAEAAAARTEAKKHALARKSPLYAEFLDTIADLDLNSEDAADAFEEFLKSKVIKADDDETEQQPKLDPNNPRKSPPAKGVEKMTTDQIKAALGEVDPSLFQGR